LAAPAYCDIDIRLSKLAEQEVVPTCGDGLATACSLRQGDNQDAQNDTSPVLNEQYLLNLLHS